MTDAVSTTTVFNGKRKLVVHLTNQSDGTGESDVVKVDKSTFTGPNGLEPTNLIVEKIDYSVVGMTAILEWDRTTDQEIAVLQGDGCKDWTEAGGLLRTGSGATGDIILTTSGHTLGDSYDITLHLRKKD